MNSRRQQILFSVIDEHIENSIPVGSNLIYEKYDISASPATIRMEMAWLTKNGYLAQLYTSGGRIPTTKAYKMFVDSIDREKEHKIKLPQVFNEFMSFPRECLKYIAEYSSSLVINFIDDNLLNAGLDVLLGEPEFYNNLEILQNLVNKLENIYDYTDKIIDSVSDNGTVVYIDKENPLLLEKCSMIISSYNISSKKQGIIALLGPTRMRYDRNIALINELVKILSCNNEPR
ncbi:MAG: hypothetical protein US76_00425 [Parcubacteria group bacterium GW2011_GWA2_38_13b]|nr:MAG: hypothetical protein US76_00425 [Parcubacteria group bacterium GW2011_GWA2_38_13b]